MVFKQKIHVHVLRWETSSCYQQWTFIFLYSSIQQLRECGFWSTHSVPMLAQFRVPRLWHSSAQNSQNSYYGSVDVSFQIGVWKRTTWRERESYQKISRQGTWVMRDAIFITNLYFHFTRHIGSCSSILNQVFKKDTNTGYEIQPCFPKSNAWFPPLSKWVGWRLCSNVADPRSSILKFTFHHFLSH